MPEGKSIYLEIFGESPSVKVLDFFLTYEGFDYSKTEVAREVDISRVTIEKVWKDLIQLEIIVKSRTIGKAELYRLNTRNLTVKLLLDTGLKLAKLRAEKEMQEVQMKINARRH